MNKKTLVTIFLLEATLMAMILVLPHIGLAQDDESADPLVPFAQMTGVPTSTTIMIGTSDGVVTTNNFYQNSLGAQEQYIILANNSNYEINYDTYFSAFYIAIDPSQYNANRTQAENDFLAILGISQQDACKLDVEEGPLSGDSIAGQSDILSFCTTPALTQ